MPDALVQKIEEHAEYQHESLLWLPSHKEDASQLIRHNGTLILRTGMLGSDVISK